MQFKHKKNINDLYESIYYFNKENYEKSISIFRKNIIQETHIVRGLLFTMYAAANNEYDVALLFIDNFKKNIALYSSLQKEFLLIESLIEFFQGFNEKALNKCKILLEIYPNDVNIVYFYGYIILKSIDENNFQKYIINESYEYFLKALLLIKNEKNPDKRIYEFILNHLAYSSALIAKNEKNNKYILLSEKFIELLKKINNNEEKWSPHFWHTKGYIIMQKALLNKNSDNYEIYLNTALTYFQNANEKALGTNLIFLRDIKEIKLLLAALSI